MRLSALSLCYRSFCVRYGVEFFVSEIESNVDCNFDEVQYIEEETQNEYESRFRSDPEKSDGFNYFFNYSAGITYQKKNFKKEAFSFCGTRYPRFTYRERLGKTETEYCQCFK